jgi:hypothetical protein
MTQAEIDDRIYEFLAERVRIDLRRDAKGLTVGLIVRGPLGQETLVSWERFDFQWQDDGAPAAGPKPEPASRPPAKRRSGAPPPRRPRSTP